MIFTSKKATVFHPMSGHWLLALKQLGYKIDWVFENTKAVLKTLNMNFPDLYIEEEFDDFLFVLDESDDMEQDLVCGSPPCSGMSRGNPKASVLHPANMETLDFGLIVQYLRPKAFLMEMVPSILSDKFSELSYGDGVHRSLRSLLD